MSLLERIPAVFMKAICFLFAALLVLSVLADCGHNPYHFIIRAWGWELVFNMFAALMCGITWQLAEEF